MKALIQRVLQASITVDGKIISSIGKGLCVLVGITRTDKVGELEYLAKKIVNLRIFDDETNGKKWEKSAKDLGYEILCVSQFTLCMELKGNKPDFHDAMAPEFSEQFYIDFLDKMKSLYRADKIKGGVFGAEMQVHIQNDGPVTIPIDTPITLQDPNFLAKQERKLEAAKKREAKSQESKSKKFEKREKARQSQSNDSAGQSQNDSGEGSSQNTENMTDNKCSEDLVDKVTENVDEIDIDDKLT